MDLYKIERIFSKILRKYPRLRNFVKISYQRIMYIISIAFYYKEENNYPIIQSITDQDAEYFFGYYDKSPWNITGKYILSLKVPFSNKHPKQGDRATIGIIDTQNNNQFISITETQTWNLQQGCMVQWLGPEFRDKIIYNDLINNKYVSIIYNIKTKDKRVLERPIYSVSNDGKHALFLNFARLHRLRPGYGYSNLPDRTQGQLHPADDGIWYLDIENNKSKLIISLDEIVKLNWDKTMEGVEHRFNHLDINPGGTRFSFLHRWEYKGITYSRLYTGNMDGTNIYCLADNQMVSHSCWKNNKQILVWCRQNDIGDRYYLFTDQTIKREIIGDGVLTEDGHPSYSPDGRYILTDTYTDRTRHRTLIIYDTKTNKRYDIGRFFAPFKYEGEVRCDLHPRWSRDGKQICFDSVHEGKRRLYVIDNPLYNIDRSLD